MKNYYYLIKSNLVNWWRHLDFGFKFLEIRYYSKLKCFSLVFLAFVWREGDSGWCLLGLFIPDRPMFDSRIAVGIVLFNYTFGYGVRKSRREQLEGK